MSWSSNFKAKRITELNHMKIQDRTNQTMLSEYYGIINGVVDPKTTHYFSDLANTHNAIEFAKKNGFMQSRMTSINTTSKMLNRDGLIKGNDLSIIAKINDDSDIDFTDKSSISSFKGFEARATIPTISLSSFIEKCTDLFGSFE